jgi:hypothetical protein
MANRTPAASPSGPPPGKKRGVGKNPAKRADRSPGSASDIDAPGASSSPRPSSSAQPALQRTPPASPYKASGTDLSPSRKDAAKSGDLVVGRVRLEPYTEREAKIERERRRGLVFVHLRTLQRLGVVIGDPVALHLPSSGVVVGQAWVGANLSEEEVHVDSLMADNCGAKFGQLAFLQRLDPSSRTLQASLSLPVATKNVVFALSSFRSLAAGATDGRCAISHFFFQLVVTRRRARGDDGGDHQSGCGGGFGGGGDSALPLPPQAASTTGASNGRPLDDFLKTWIRQSIGAQYRPASPPPSPRDHSHTDSITARSGPLLCQGTPIHHFVLRPAADLPGGGRCAPPPARRRQYVQSLRSPTSAHPPPPRRAVAFGRITEATSFKYHAATTATTASGATGGEAGGPQEGDEVDAKEKEGPTEWDYGSIGGLKREIEAVREVVELAVNSPKLFTEYGTRGILT